MTVEQLREEGYEVRTTHCRVLEDKLVPNHKIRKYGWMPAVSPRGGFTTVLLYKDDDLVVGWAACSSRDNYNKKLGRTIALGRAVKQLKNGKVEA